MLNPNQKKTSKTKKLLKWTIKGTTQAVSNRLALKRGWVEGSAKKEALKIIKKTLFS